MLSENKEDHFNESDKIQKSPPNPKSYDSNKQNSSGAIPKQLLCVECSLDTKDILQIFCAECNKPSHIKCVKHENFDNQGNYRCTKCFSLPEVANEKIYVKLKSELLYFIVNREVDENNAISYEKFAHKSCGVTQWPNQDAIEILAFQISDEQGKSSTCVKCDKLIPSQTAVCCKGCLTIFHPECCCKQGREEACQVCYHILKAKKFKIEESHALNLPRLMRRREIKIISQNKNAIVNDKSDTDNDVVDNNDGSSNENDNSDHENKINANVDNNSINCAGCDENSHNLINCRESWKFSGLELTKMLLAKKICVLCGQEAYSGKGHKCSMPSCKICYRAQHKNLKHYEILCSLRERESSLNNYTNETSRNLNSSLRSIERDKNLQQVDGSLNDFHGPSYSNFVDKKEFSMSKEQLLQREYLDEFPNRAYAMPVLKQKTHTDENAKIIAPLTFREESSKSPNIQISKAYVKNRLKKISETKMGNKFPWAIAWAFFLNLFLGLSLFMLSGFEPNVGHFRLAEKDWIFDQFLRVILLENAKIISLTPTIVNTLIGKIISLKIILLKSLEYRLLT